MLASDNAPYDERLNCLVEQIQKYMHLPDPAPFILILATVVAHLIPGYPVWLMLVGPPSSGKTELLYTIMLIPKVFMTSTLTEAGLLSGTAQKERQKKATGGLLRTIGSKGILVAKDFTTVLSMNRDARSLLIAALREIYDGEWIRRLGTDGGQEISWKGRIGFLGGVTEDIDSHHSVIASMGDRSMYYRMEEIPGKLIADKVLNRNEVSEETRQDLQQLVAAFIEFLDIPDRAEPLTDEIKEWLSVISNVTAKARSAVERDSYRREIIQVHSPESPGRLAAAFGQLYCALNIIGCSYDEAKRLIKRVAIDCIPRDRSRLLHLLAINESGLKVNEMRKGKSVDYPVTAVRRALEEMECLRIVNRNKEDVWKLTISFRSLWERL